MEAFDTALLELDGGAARLLAGEGALADCARRLGVAAADPAKVMAALAAADPGHAQRLADLIQSA